MEDRPALPAQVDSIVELPADVPVGRIDTRAGDGAWRFIGPRTCGVSAR